MALPPFLTNEENEACLSGVTVLYHTTGRQQNQGLSTGSYTTYTAYHKEKYLNCTKSDLHLLNPICKITGRAYCSYITASIFNDANKVIESPKCYY